MNLLNSHRTAPKRLSAEALERAVQLLGCELSQLAVCERLRAEGLADVSQQSLSKALARREREGATVARRRRQDPRTVARSATGRGGAVVGAALGAADLPSRPEGDKELAALEAAVAELGDVPAELAIVPESWLPRIRGMAEKALDEQNSAAARPWIELFIKVRQRQIEAAPAPAVDPSSDPAFAPALDQLIGAVQRLVEQHEAKP